MTKERHDRFQRKKAEIEKELERLKATILPPTPELNAFLVAQGSSPVQTGLRLSELLKRPELDYPSLSGVDPARPALSKEVWEQVSITLKYEG